MDTLKSSTDSKISRKQILILDWDDTLCPTTAALSGEHEEEQIDPVQLQKLSKLVLDLLTRYTAQCGSENVFIVTNGGKDWIFSSLMSLMNICRRLRVVDNSFQSIFNLLFSDKIKTISASHHFGSAYPQRPTVWKYLAFQHIIERMVGDGDEKCALISIGDSMAEYTASKEAAKASKKKQMFVHRLKLKEKPMIKEMNKQLSFIASIGSVFDKEEDVDIKLH